MDADLVVFGETGDLSVRTLLRAHNDNRRWSNVPFFLRTGKRLLLEELEARLAAQLEQGLPRREQVSLPVSGDNAPRPVYRRLRQRPLSWERIDRAHTRP